MRRIICTTAAVLITINSAGAEIALYGAGASTCAEFANLYRSSPRDTEDYYTSWAQGFLSGANRPGGESRDLSSVPAKRLKMLMRDYCNDHPLVPYMRGVIYLYLQLPIISEPQGKK